MLRPATPLAILLFAAFALLLLSVLSTPVIKAIPLGVYKPDGDVVNFGVFGYCRGNTCSPIEIGYDTSILAPPPPVPDSKSSSDENFNLNASTRMRLSAILIVHPIAAFLTLVMFGMAVAAHFHSPSHSSRYLCGLFIFGILTFLVTLLAFLIDVLLFVPHLAWGSWLVLAATILVFISFIVSCAMRRTLVGRKARKKRIAENAEMSGENYYNRQAQQDAASAVASSLQPTVPSVSGANGTVDKLPTFAAYEHQRDDHSSDERIPLTARPPSERSPNAPVDAVASDPPSTRRSFSSSASALQVDQYGNPIASADAYGMRRGPSMERMDGRGRGVPGGYRGRGNGRGAYAGYGPPPNGRPGYGPPNGRGAYGPQARGGYGPGPNGRGGYAPRGAYGGGMRAGRTPPPSYTGGAPYDGRTPPPGVYGGYAPGRQASPATRAPYDDNPSMPSVSTGVTNAGGYQPYRPDDANDLPRAESPPPLPGTDPSSSGSVGQAVEMDHTTGSPAHPPAGFEQFNSHIRDSDTDVAGMLALQEARTYSPQRHDTVDSQAGKISRDEQYVPPRQAWNQGPGRASPRNPSPLHTTPSPQDPNGGMRPAPLAASNGGNYYEDIDPRFAEPSPPAQQPAQEGLLAVDDPHQGPGARSPTVSERSGFTSVSQRGVNPRWNPAQGYNQPMPPRRPANRNDVNILNSNPDFQLPGRRGPAAAPPKGGAGGGMTPGSAYPGI
ncbi:pali-domain-containing protein [Nemania sp. FL0916]|nr:pali-domain-containing protein [Nemania sp. FL0916]